MYINLTVLRSTVCHDVLTTRTHVVSKKFTKKIVRRRPLIGGNKKGQQHSLSNFEEPQPSIHPLGCKMKDTNLTGGNVDNTGLTTVIDVPAQGVSYVQRVADRCRFVRLDLYINVFNNPANANDVFRLLVVQEIGASTGPPLGTALLQYNDSYSPLLYNAGKLYHILEDHPYTLALNSSTSVRAIRLNLMPKIREIQFITGTTTPYSGQIYVYMISSNGSTNKVIFNMHARLWFTDSD